MFQEVMLNQISNHKLLINMIDFTKKLLTSHNNLDSEIEQLIKNQNKEFLNINQLQNNMPQFYQDQIVKCFKEFHRKSLVMSIHNRTFYIFVLLANANVFVHSALFMVYFLS
jgi:hypothetical protein